MHDQAHTLRRLVRDCVHADVDSIGPRPALVSVAGGKPGVGTTTIALNLAVAFQQLSRPAILVDASRGGGPLGLRAGPGGIQILAATASGGRKLSLASDLASARWIKELVHLAPSTEIIVVDAGSGPHAAITSLWEISDVALLVISAEPEAIVGGYTLLKLLLAEAPHASVYGLVNRATSAAAAGTAFARIHRACRRFLALELRPAGFVPHDPAFALAETSGTPIVLAPAGRPARDRLVRAAYTLNEGTQAVRANSFSVISSEERFNLEPRSDRYTRTLSVADQSVDFAD
jgi:flagellar biosynthesis protein FlhG